MDPKPPQVRVSRSDLLAATESKTTGGKPLIVRAVVVLAALAWPGVPHLKRVPNHEGSVLSAVAIQLSPYERFTPRNSASMG